MSMCIIKPAPNKECFHQAVMVPKLFILPVQRGCYCEGCLKMVGGLLHLKLFMVYVAKGTVVMAGKGWFMFAQGEIDCLGCSFFCSLKLLVFIQ